MSCMEILNGKFVSLGKNSVNNKVGVRCTVRTKFGVRSPIRLTAFKLFKLSLQRNMKIPVVIEF